MTTHVDRRSVLAGLLGTAAGVLGFARPVLAQLKPTMTVYKDASCGCCQSWVDYVQANGYRSMVINTDMGPIKKKYQVNPNLQSCHTTLIGGYVIEGHVPVSDIARLLKARPKGIVGLTIPGMPASAPGMDIRPFQPYTVLTFDAKGLTTVFAKHDKPS